MTSPEVQPSTPPVQRAPSIAAQLLHEAKALFTTEFKLARRELSESISRAGSGLTLLAVALLFALVAFHALALAAVMGLVALGLHMGWAALIVFGVLVALAGILALMGKSRLKPENLKPKRTVEQIKADIQTLEEVRHG